jgi:hypothetical protein
MYIPNWSAPEQVTQCIQAAKQANLKVNTCPMKTSNIIYLTLLLLLTTNVYGQSNDIELRIVNQQNEPIEAACVGVAATHQFWYSDTAGVVVLPLKAFAPKDSLTFLHISYKQHTVDLKSLIASQADKNVIQLISDVVPLEEVVVKPLNPKQYLEEAIALIPTLYAPTLASPLSLHAEIDVFDANDSTSMVYYKGALQLHQPKDKKRPNVRTANNIERIADGAEKELYPIRINKSILMVSINNHKIIHNPDKYTFSKYQYIQYRGVDAVQLFYHAKKGKAKATGYVIIQEDTKAIRVIQLKMSPLKKAMLSLVKGRKRFTDIESHSIETNYSRNAQGVYEFESGVQHAVYTNHIKKKEKRISVNSYLNRIDPTGIVYESEEVPINKFLTQ